MEFICVKCKHVFEAQAATRCPICGFRIISKTRPKKIKRVDAI